MLALSVIVLSFITALPNFISGTIPTWLPSQTINLGLDLRGGSQLLLSVDFPLHLRDQLELLQDSIKTTLRTKKIGYSELKVEKHNIIFKLRDSKLQKEATTLLGKALPYIDIEKINGDYFQISFQPEYIKDLRTKVIEQSIEIIRRRVDETGTKEPSIQRQGEENILLQVPGLNDPEHLKRLLGKTAKLTLHLTDESVPLESAVNGQIPAGSMLLFSEKNAENINYPLLLKKKVLLSGDLLTDARATISSTDNKAMVNFSLNPIGTRQFAEITKANVGKALAIVLDNKVICAPIINEPITGGEGIISGNYTAESAQELALLLRAGALPAPLTVVEERTVGPNLGTDSIEAGKKAAIVSMILIAIFMAWTYGIPGIFANVALCINIVIILALLSVLQATLTMPGIAGIILTMGMSVDANVLIFERIREELVNGLSPIAATDKGFKQAFTTILDSNLTTIIVAIFLYSFGSGVVKGFAVTLIIGISTSMFSAITLTKLMMATWLNYTRPKKIVL
jgi:preprotein translocase subunit SecD